MNDWEKDLRHSVTHFRHAKRTRARESPNLYKFGLYSLFIFFTLLSLDLYHIIYKSFRLAVLLRQEFLNPVRNSLSIGFSGQAL